MNFSLEPKFFIIYNFSAKEYQKTKVNEENSQTFAVICITVIWSITYQKPYITMHKYKTSSRSTELITLHTCIHTYIQKPVGDWISAPNPNVVAMATRVGFTTFCMVPLNRPSRKLPGRCKHLRSM